MKGNTLYHSIGTFFIQFKNRPMKLQNKRKKSDKNKKLKS